MKRTTKKASRSKETWEQFLRNPQSKKLLSKVWEAEDPKQEYRKTIDHLYKKYMSGTSTKKSNSAKKLKRKSSLKTKKIKRVASKPKSKSSKK